MVNYPKDWTELEIRDIWNIAPKSSYGVKKVEKLKKGHNICYTSGQKIFKVEDYLVEGEYIFVNNGGTADFKYRKGKSLYTDHIIGFSVKNNINTKLIYYYLLRLSDYIQDKFFKGIGIKNLNRRQFERFRITIPSSLKEQEAIANTLTSFDNYIESLEKLIQKKKNIRDGTLEDLMSCKKRLEGFSGKWKENCLNNILTVYDGVHQTPKYTNKGIKFVSVENINDLYNTTKYISVSDFKRDYKVYPEKGDILMTRIGDIGTSTLIKSHEKIAYYVSLALFKNIKINGSFLNYYIKSKNFKNELNNRVLHHAVPIKINKGDIGKCIIKYPFNQEEQQAISDILTKMDKEIESLEKKKNKIIKIREGAMNDLLTGRIRLSY